MTDDLQKKLRRLGVVKGADAITKPPPKTVAPPGQKSPGSLPGKVVQTEYGVFWLDKREYPSDAYHGNHSFSLMTGVLQQDLSVFGVYGLGPHPAFVDTETTGLAGGAGTIAFLIGIGVWDSQGLVIHLVFVRNPDEELPALHYVADILATCTGLVTYNGRAFDLPLLQTRFIMNRMAPNWLDLPHLDLLLVARRLWQDHLPSRRLGDVEQHILGITRTDEDLPSYLIPYFYRQYLETGDTAEMRKVIYHNVIDVLTLVSLLIHTTIMVSQPEQMNLAATEWAGVGTVYDKAGSTQKALAAWERALALTDSFLPHNCLARLCGSMGSYYKRRVSWEKALAIWDLWVEQVPDAVNPLVEKAKFYEWTAGNSEQALRETEIALSRVERFYEGYQQERLLDALNHRKHRLELKLQHVNADESE
ncbi:MAG: ribonuclease H-like domain-containing protein [Anaerolineae bacterium]|nr:ribonuclease H-like domain-containing protein [Anaerolineae bacterium]